MLKIIRKADIVLMISVIVLSIGLYFTLKVNQGESSGRAHIYYDNHLVYTVDLSSDGTTLLTKDKYPLLLDDLEVEVKDGKIRISKETSPNNICSKQGWTSSPIAPLVCLPNHVYVQIESENAMNDGVDALIQ